MINEFTVCQAFQHEKPERDFAVQRTNTKSTMAENTGIDILCSFYVHYMIISQQWIICQPIYTL